MSRMLILVSQTTKIWISFSFRSCQLSTLNLNISIIGLGLWDTSRPVNDLEKLSRIALFSVNNISIFLNSDSNSWLKCPYPRTFLVAYSWRWAVHTEAFRKFKSLQRPPSSSSDMNWILFAKHGPMVARVNEAMDQWEVASEWWLGLNTILIKVHRTHTLLWDPLGDSK